MNEKKELLNMLREMWQKGSSPLRRIYSSWEELEANVEVKTESTLEKKSKVQSCPNCGAKQKVTNPLEGFFPYQNCTECNQAFYVNKNTLSFIFINSTQNTRKTSRIASTIDCN